MGGTKMQTQRLLGLICLLLSLSGCRSGDEDASLSPVPTDTSTTIGPILVSPTAEQPVFEYEPVFEAVACPMRLPPNQVESQTVDCGYLVVPEDRENADGRSLRLAVAIFHPPGGASKPDPIIYLVGGPGGSALEFLYISFDKLFAPVLAAGRDLVLFDQRGVGRSQPALDCLQAQALGRELLDHELDGEGLTDEEVDGRMGEAYYACAQTLSAIADLGAYHTAASAADVNDLRIALNYDQVNLWGISYGTRLALGVMRDYPQGLRSVVLDSTYPPDADMYLETPANLDRALNLLFEACEAEETCNAAFPDLRQVLFDTVERLNASPIRTEITDPFTRSSYPALLDGDSLLALVFQLLYQTTVLPDLPQLIYDAAEGDFDGINRIRGTLLGQSTVSSQGMGMAVQCHEEIPFSTLEQYQAVLTDYPHLASFFQESIVGEGMYEACETWESGRAEAIENQPVTSTAPTLVMHGEYDPITPPHWGQQAAETLPNGYYFLYPAVGHGASVVEGCPRDMMIAFLDDPTHAPAGACIAQMEGVRFVVPAEVMETVTLAPYTNQEMGISGLKPDGWTESAPGVFSRGESGLDSVVLIAQAVPGRAADRLAKLTRQLNLGALPSPVGEREANDLGWDLYAVEVQGLFVDIALAESGELSLVVLLQGTPEEHPSLYEQAFLPAVDALKPIE